MKKALLKDDYLNNCTHRPQLWCADRKCKGVGDKAICGRQCIPERLATVTNTQHTTMLCISDLKVIANEQGQVEYYIVDGIYPKIFDTRL